MWMIFAALWLSLFLGMSVGLGRLTYRAWTAQREGRVEPRRTLIGAWNGASCAS